MVENWSEITALFPDFATRIGAALLCGLLLGVERERHEKPAGLRTIVLITVGSTVYMILSNLVPLMRDWPAEVTRTDPSRIAAQVVSGIGFLGAGTIIQARGAIHGLTTAAVIWVAAAIGLCAGMGFPLLAVCVTLVVLASLVAMRPLHDYIARLSKKRSVTLMIPNDALVLQRIDVMLEEQDLHASPLAVSASGDELSVAFTFHATAGATSRLLDALSHIDGIRGTVVSLQ